MNSRIAAMALLATPACTRSDSRLAAAFQCDAPQHVAALPRQLDEASGIARARSRNDLFWVHNDSEGEPSLYAIDHTGRLLAQLSLPATISQVDWEDIDTAPCPAGDCIYIADIGDNLHERADIAILRFPEPAVDTREIATVERFPVRYPDGAHDAEAMFVLPGGDVYIITKGRDTPVALYRYAAPLRAGETVTLQLVQQLTEGLVQLPDMVTGATATRNGRVIAIRTYARLHLYRFDSDTLAVLGSPVDLSQLREPQGEGIAAADDSTFFLVSERRSLSYPAPLSRIRCTIPP